MLMKSFNLNNKASMIIFLTVMVAVLALLLFGLMVRVTALEDRAAKQAAAHDDVVSILKAHDKCLYFLSEQDPKTEALQSYYDSIKGVA